MQVMQDGQGDGNGCQVTRVNKMAGPLRISGAGAGAAEQSMAHWHTAHCPAGLMDRTAVPYSEMRCGGCVSEAQSKAPVAVWLQPRVEANCIQIISTASDSGR